MKQTAKALLSLLIIAAVSLGALWGGDLLTRTLLTEQSTAQVAQVFGELLPAKRYDELSTDGWEKINAAYRAVDDGGQVLGYAVTVTVEGYVSDIEVHVAVSADGERIRGLRIGEHRESAGYGARIVSTVFTDRFKNAVPPLYLAGKNGQAGTAIEALSGATASSQAVVDAANEAASFVGEQV